MSPLPAGRPARVLLVEDNDADVRLTREALREAGEDVRLSAVGDGEQALAYLRREAGFAEAPRPDLVLLDLNLPRKNGLEVLDEMRADERLASIPVIVLTSSAAAPGRRGLLRPRRQRVRGQAAGARRVHGSDRRDPRLLARGGAATLRVAMVTILIAAVLGGLVGAFGTALWLRRKDAGPARERRAGGAAAALQRAILDSLQDGVVVYDEDDRIVFYNPAAVEILGVPREALSSGVRTWDPLDAEGRPLAGDERPVAITARTGEPCVGVDIGLRTAAGDVRWTTVSTRALHEHPGANGRHAVVAAFTDITDRRLAQQALERTNAELAQFAYVASHDLSEPLRMVSSYLQLLRRRYHGQIDEDADEFIDFAVEGANRMRALIEDLLAYSRAGRGAEPRPMDLGHVMADVLSSLAAAVADARAQVSVGPMPMVLGDRLSLAQLLQNLVANALKFRSGPRACVWIAAEREHEAMWRDHGRRRRHRDRPAPPRPRVQDVPAPARPRGVRGDRDRPRDLPQDRRAPGRRDLGRRSRGRRLGVLVHPPRGARARARGPRHGRARPRRYDRGLSTTVA